MALTFLGFGLFGSYGLWMVRAEEADLRRALERETRLLGRALQVAAGNSLNTQRLDDAQRMLERLETIDPRLKILVVSRSGDVLLSSRGIQVTEMVRRTVHMVDDAVRTGAHPPQDRALFYDEPSDPNFIVAGLPLTSGDPHPEAFLVLVQSLDEMRRDLEATQASMRLSIGLFVAVTWLLSAGLGTLYLGRPLRRLAQAMRLVRGGDLSSGIDAPNRDEITEVATEFNLMVADLRAARAALEEAADGRRRDQKALQEADKLVTIGQLSAGLAHEIGSPLQILAGRARNLQSRADDADEVRRLAPIMVQQCDRIARIVEQLLQYARRKAAHSSEVDALATARTVVDLLQFEAKRRGVSLELVAESAPPTIAADADQLQQLVMNLVNNALQATRAGGHVRVLLGPHEGPGETSLRITVVDDGVGIPPEIQGKLFDPFFSTRAAEGGTGLGLAVVRSIVTDHRGQIRVESAVEKGTTVTVTLPCRPWSRLPAPTPPRDEFIHAPEPTSPRS
ncbi:MAG: HAMP domain-containing protein [Deltaproteobacteria bacterium]|nr:HAMP domain-containing protein [Deltaproteobacteria bacterium]